MYIPSETPGKVRSPMWERLPVPEEIDGVEPDPLYRGHRQFRHKPYEGNIPAAQDIENYRQICKAKCLEESDGARDTTWSKCVTSCSHEVQNMIFKASGLRSSSRHPGN